MRLRPWFRPDPAGAAYNASIAGFKGAASRRKGGAGKGGRGGEGKWRRGAGREGKERGGEVDCDAQLEKGRRLAKAGPGNLAF